MRLAAVVCDRTFWRDSMTRRKALSNDARQIIQNLFEAKEFSTNHLSALTGINRRTIFRINQQVQETGSVERDGRRTGRPRRLGYPDVHVSF